MRRNQRIVDIRPYLDARRRQSAVPSQARFKDLLTPVGVSGMLMVGSSVAFLGFVALRVAAAGLLDAVVLTLLAVDAAIAGLGLLMLMSVPAFRAMTVSRRTKRLSSAMSSQPEEVSEPVSLAIERRRRRSIFGTTTYYCTACESSFESAAGTAVCANCGTPAARSA